MGVGGVSPPRSLEMLTTHAQENPTSLQLSHTPSQLTPDMTTSPTKELGALWAEASLSSEHNGH